VYEDFDIRYIIYVDMLADEIYIVCNIDQDTT